MDPKTVDHDHVEPGGVAGKLTGESFKAQGRGEGSSVSDFGHVSCGRNFFESSQLHGVDLIALVYLHHVQFSTVVNHGHPKCGNTTNPLLVTIACILFRTF